MLSSVPVAVIIVEILDDLARQKKTVRQGNLIYVRTTDIIGRKPKEELVDAIIKMREWR